MQKMRGEVGSGRGYGWWAKPKVGLGPGIGRWRGAGVREGDVGKVWAGGMRGLRHTTKSPAAQPALIGQADVVVGGAVDLVLLPGYHRRFPQMSRNMS